MKFSASITIMPLKALLDPQGKAVTMSMKNLKLPEIDNVRIGKHITLDVEAVNQDDARGKIETACQKLLANPIMESYNYTIQES